MTFPKPFHDDVSSTSIAGLTIENGSDAIAVYGNLTITRDQAGLAAARELSRFLIAVVAILQSDENLPAKIAPPAAPKSVPNPFA